MINEVKEINETIETMEQVVQEMTNQILNGFIEAIDRIKVLLDDMKLVKKHMNNDTMLAFYTHVKQYESQGKPYPCMSKKLYKALTKYFYPDAKFFKERVGQVDRYIYLANAYELNYWFHFIKSEVLILNKLLSEVPVDQLDQLEYKKSLGLLIPLLDCLMVAETVAFKVSTSPAQNGKVIDWLNGFMVNVFQFVLAESEEQLKNAHSKILELDQLLKETK